ncbi:MAG: hypothetical protein ACI4Q7_03515, partial [Candidatus Avelusimicrobium sp.]
QLEDQPIRTSFSASDSYNYEGLNRRADGMLTSMNIQNRAGRQGVAIGADRERLEGTASNNDFGLAAADNLGKRISVPNVGSSAVVSESDGLGTGGVDMTEIPAGVRTGTPGSSPAGAPPVSVSSRAQAAPTAAAAPPAASGGNSGGRLAPASMARASGNSFNASSGSAGGGASGGTAGRRNAPSRPEGYNFSGSMPGGSNVVSAYETLGKGGNGSTFIAGGRGSTSGPGRRSLKDKDNDLKDISKRSADAARNSNRAANEGSRAFLAGGRNSGGMVIDSGEELATTGSTDLETPTDNNLKAIGNWEKQQDDFGDRKAKARKKLTWMWLGTIAGGIALLYAAAFALSALKGPWRWVVAALFLAAIAVPCAFLIKEAVAYKKEFSQGTSDVLMTVVCCLTGMALIGGMTFTCINPDGAKKWLTTKMVKKLIGLASSVGIGLVMSTMMSGFSGK